MDTNDKPQTMPDNIPPFVKFCCANLPAVFDDSLSYYEALCALWKYLQDCIDTINNNAALEEEYITKFNVLKEYVEHYFDNLDVQEEINNKLDEMVNNGSFELLFAKYVDPYFENINTELRELNTKVNSLNDNSPAVVTNVSQMTDHSKIYVLTTDGNWYYWNGSVWTVGGAYDSDAVLNDIKWYLNDVASDGNSLFNPWTAWEGGLSTADGTDVTTGTTPDNYWTTDYILLPQAVEMMNRRYYLSLGLPFKANLTFWKFCVYDENKQFLYTDTTRRNSIRVNVGGDIDDSEWKYVRIQFKKTDIAFSDRYKLLVTPNTDLVLPSDASRYTSVDSDGIKSNSIVGNRLDKKLFNATNYVMLEQGIVPFSKTDFFMGSIASSNGDFSIVDTRLSTNNLYKIPAGTTLEFDNDWLGLSLLYSQTDEFIGRYNNSWSPSIYFPVTAYVRFVFKNDTIGNINSESSIINLLENISITKDTGKFSYQGDKINLANTYGALATGFNLLGQDSAIASDGNIMSFDSNGYYKVFNISGEQIKGTTALDMQATIAPHANCVFFGTEKYDEDDTYPLVYANAYNNTSLPKGALYAYRLKNDLTTELKQTIVVGFTTENIWTGGGYNTRPYGNFLMDTDNGKLYAYTMIDNLNVTRFFRFSMPELSDGATVTLQESDIEEYFDVPYFYFIQGGCYWNGKIYASCGFTADDCKLHVVDLSAKQEVSVIPLGGFCTEPETVFVYKNELYLSSVFKLYKLQF